MTIPTSFAVFAHIYTVETEANLARDENVVGRSCSNACKILLDPSLRKSEIEEVFWHEKIHVAAKETGVKLSERDTDPMAQALHQIECSSLGNLFPTEPQPGRHR